MFSYGGTYFENSKGFFMTPITKIDFSIHDLIVHDVKIPKGIKNTVVGIYEVGNKPGYVLKGNLYGKNIILLDTDFDKEFEDEFTSILFENMFLFCEKNHFSSKYMNLLGHSHIFRNMENMKIYSYVFETKKNLPKYTMISGTEKYGYSLFNVTKKIGKITLDEEYDSFAGSFYPANSYFYEHPLVGIDLNRDGVFEKDEIFYHCEKINVNGNIFKLKEVKPSGSDGIKIDYEKLTEEIEENSVKNKLEFIMNNGEFRDSGKPKIVFYSANKDEYYEFWIKKLEKTKKELDIDVVVLSSIFDFDLSLIHI